MFDNTPRRGNRAFILDGATPDLFEKWLSDVIVETKNNNLLDEKFIFINAWNEWAEGAYLEPDLRWRYGYLTAVANAIIKTRNNNELKQIYNKNTISNMGGVCYEYREAANDLFLEEA